MNLTQMTIISTTAGKNSLEEMEPSQSTKESRIQYLGAISNNLKNNRMISVHFQHKLFNIPVIHVYDPTTKTEEAEVEWFYEDLYDLLELTPKGDVLFITGDWNAKVGNQEIPGVTGKFVLGVQNETRTKVNRVFPRECTDHSKDPLPTAQEMTQHMDSIR